MFEDLCIYNGKVFCPFFDGDSLYIEAYTYAFHGKTFGNNFQEEFQVKIPFKDSIVHKVQCKVVENHSLGLQSLVILVESSTKPYFYSFTDGFYENKFVELKCDVWLKDIKAHYNCNYCLSHGPTLIQIGDTLEVYSFSHHIKKKHDLSKISLKSKCTNILQFSSFQDVSTSNSIEYLLAFVSQTPNENCIKTLSFNQDCETGTFSDAHCLDTKMFFPVQYQCDVTALEIFAINIFESYRCKITENVKESPNHLWGENTTIVCASNQCLIFSNGCLKFCCSSSFSDVVFIKTAISGASKEINVLLQSLSKGVCCINIKNEALEKKIKVWKKAVAVLLGDILMNGSKQLLLINNTNAFLWQNECEISEFLSTTTTVPVVHSDIPTEYLANTVVGLGKKVVDGKLALAGKQQEISEKTAAMIDVLMRLENHCSEDTVSHKSPATSFQDSLVDIILCKDENKQQQHNLEKPALAIKLCNHWTTIFNECWIMCWTFTNRSDKCICHPSISILIQEEQVQCLQKIFVHNSLSFSFDNTSKKQIDPDEYFTVVASIQIPNFTAQTLIASSVLSWYIGSLDDFDNEFMLPENERTLLQQQFSSKLNLSVGEVFKRKESGEKLNKDVLPLRVLQQRIMLCITALNSSLSKLEDELMTNQSYQMHLAVLNVKSKMLTFERVESPLYAVSIIFKHLDDKTIEAEAFTRNEQQSVLLVHWLHHNLPDDIAIFPKEHRAKNCLQMKKKILSAMKDEVDLLSSSLIAHNLNLEQLKKNTDLSDMKQLLGVGNVCIPKNTFLRIRKALAKKECITDNIARNLSNL